MAFVTMRIWNGLDWDVVSASGAIGGVNVFIQDTDPQASGKYVWIQTNADADGGFTIWFNDGV